MLLSSCFRESGDTEFVTDFSDMLLFKLLTTSSQSTQDSDKVKSNAVRAVGNLLRYLPERSLGEQAGLGWHTAGFTPISGSTRIYNITHIRKEGNGLFNDALTTFYLRLYGVGYMVKNHKDS